jgi:hypothetical protein
MGQLPVLPDWYGPPDGLVPGVLALELFLVSTDDLAVWLGAGYVYPTGVAFDFEFYGRAPIRGEGDEGDGAWRLGVRLADGRVAQATSFGGAFGKGPDVDRASAADFTTSPPPERVMLLRRGGSGTGSRWTQRYWLWPLPPPEQLTITCRWPAVGLSLASATIDVAELQGAATRSEQLW